MEPPTFALACLQQRVDDAGAGGTASVQRLRARRGEGQHLERGLRPRLGQVSTIIAAGRIIVTISLR